MKFRGTNATPKNSDFYFFKAKLHHDGSKKEKSIQELRLGYLKCGPQVLEHLFNTLEMFEFIKTLRISGMKLGDPIY